MKKIVFSAFFAKCKYLFLAGVMLLGSCTEHGTFSSVDKSKESKDPFCDIRNFNDSLIRMRESDVEVSTKGFLSRFIDVMIVAGSDLGGFAVGVNAVKDIAIAFGVTTGGIGGGIIVGVGGAVCAAGASAAAYRTFVAKKSSGSIKLSAEELPVLNAQSMVAAYRKVKQSQVTYVNLDLPEEYKSLNLIAGIHNEVLSNDPDFKQIAKFMRANSSQEGSLSIDPDLLMTIDYSKVEYLNDPEYVVKEAKLLESSEYTAVCDDIIKVATDSYSGEVFDLKPYLEAAQNTLSENENLLLGLYYHVMKTYPRDLSEVVYISNEYIRMIEKTGELSDSEKQMAYLAIAIAANSTYHWCDNL